jgi:hypothetical protein
MKTKVFIVVITQCLLIGIMAPVSAQSSFTQITSSQSAVLYLDDGRITKYVNSRLIDGWVKKIMTEQDKKNLEKQAKTLKKKRNVSKVEKEKAELLKKASYQLMHQQFDPINFKYKVLEVYSYDAKGQLLVSNTNQPYWLTIPVDSIEEKTMIVMNEYIQNHVDKVMMK